MAIQTRQQPEPGVPLLGEPAKVVPTNERIKQTKAREPRRDSGLAMLILLGLIALCSIPLAIDLNQPAVWTQQEALSIGISTETHDRKTPITTGETSLDAWTPVYQGASRWDLPPGGVWLNQIMYLGMPADATTNQATESPNFVLRSRLGALAMALLLVASVYWAGHSIGGTLTGTLAGLVAMTMPLVVGFGRISNPHIAAMAWSALSIAGALWAMRPLRASPALGRQLIGWLVCGVGLGSAALCAGPIIAPGTVLCTVVIAAICPRRIGHIMGLLVSTSIAALLVTPWILHVHDHDPDVWQSWLNQVNPTITDAGWSTLLRQGGWRLSLAAMLGGLWLLWLIPAVTQPFSTSSGSSRRKMLLGWAWLVTAAVLITIAPGKTRLSLMLFTVAPASVSIALVIKQFHDLSAEGRHARLWLITRWLSCGAMLLLAIALPTIALLINSRPDLVAWLPQHDPALFEPMHWTFYAGVSLALLLITLLAFRFALAHHPAQTMTCLAIWLLVFFSTAAIPLSRGPLLSTPASPPQLSAPAADTTTP